jgi:hypothetical protein
LLDIFGTIGTVRFERKIVLVAGIGISNYGDGGVSLVLDLSLTLLHESIDLLKLNLVHSAQILPNVSTNIYLLIHLYLLLLNILAMLSLNRQSSSSSATLELYEFTVGNINETARKSFDKSASKFVEVID